MYMVSTRDTDSMHFTLDGEVRGSVSRSTVREGLWPFPDNEFYIILNQSVGMEGDGRNLPTPPIHISPK